jgi:HIRAN domain-containing protein
MKLVEVGLRLGFVRVLVVQDPGQIAADHEQRRQRLAAARLSVPLDEQIEIVGEQFYSKEIRKLFRECGMPITAAGCTLESEMCFLVPEPWNPHDPNAVAVMVRTFHVGHLPAALAMGYP